MVFKSAHLSYFSLWTMYIWVHLKTWPLYLIISLQNMTSDTKWGLCNDSFLYRAISHYSSASALMSRWPKVFSTGEALVLKPCFTISFDRNKVGPVSGNSFPTFFLLVVFSEVVYRDYILLCVKSISCQALYEEMPVTLSCNFSPAMLSKQFVKATPYIVTHEWATHFKFSAQISCKAGYSKMFTLLNA